MIPNFLPALGLWHVKRKVPPKAHSPPLETFIIYDDSPTPGVDVRHRAYSFAGQVT
jgi:hypothetical protein